MALLERMLTDDAVYWPPAGYDDYGKVLKGNAIAIKCRWEESNEIFQDSSGQERISKAKVFVSKDGNSGGPSFLVTYEPQGILWHGAYVDADRANPLKNFGAMEIQKFDKLPNIRGKKFLLTAWL